MAKRRTKKQKQSTAHRRKTEYSFSKEGVSVVEATETRAVTKKATTPKAKKGVESSFGAEITKLLYQDLRKTGIVTAVVFCILFGIYVYVR